MMHDCCMYIVLGFNTMSVSVPMILLLLLASPSLCSSHIIPGPNNLCDKPPCSEQVHLQLGGPGQMVVVYISHNTSTKSQVTYWEASTATQKTVVNGSAGAYSQLMWVSSELIDPTMGVPGASTDHILDLENTTSWALRAPFSPYGRGASYDNPSKVEFGIGAYNNPQMIYTSPVIHTVTLSGLTAGTSYTYQVANDNRNFTFLMPPNADGSASVYPFTVGLTADLGQTDISHQTVSLLQERLEESVNQGVGAIMLLSGDLSYADGYYPRWDSWGRFMERIAAQFPIMTVGGNHEYGDGEAWVSYNARYPMPYVQSGSLSNLWWSRDVGPMHLIGLCSYAQTAPGSLQYEWLQQDLAQVDRTNTPWIIVMMHAPWYNSNSGHRAESELMRVAMEPLLVNHGVDIVLNGHVHAYERILPVYEGCRTPCGPTYLNLGNGGNREGAYLPWLFPKPFYSAFRASTFGPAILTIQNATHAFYNHTRVGCQNTNKTENHENLDGADCSTINYDGTDNSHNASVGTDITWIVRPTNRLAACPVPSCSQPVVPLTPMPTAAPTSAAPTPSNGGGSKHCDEEYGGIWALVGGIIGGLLIGTLIGYFYFGYSKSGMNRIKDREIIDSYFDEKEEELEQVSGEM